MERPAPRVAAAPRDLVCVKPATWRGQVGAGSTEPARYILMLGQRLSLEGRLRHDGLHFWPLDPGETTRRPG
jgi:hypothetical protein